MKKQLMALLSFVMVCCLFSPALGATLSGDTEVINGNTYIYPNGFTDTGNNGLIIIKPYTDEQIREAEIALEPAFQSFYLSNDTALCNAIATDEFHHICEYNGWTPDFSTFYSYSSFSIDMPPFSEEKTVSEATSNPTSISYQIMMKDDRSVYAGLQHIVIKEGAYHVMGHGDFASAYITYDLRTHAVELYAMLKDSGLDLTKTTVKLFMCEAGQYFLFSDGILEFVTPIGMQVEFSPYETGAGYPDASASFRLISGRDFIKTMAKVAQEVAEAKAANAASYDGTPQMGGNANPDTPVSNGNILLYIAIVCFTVAAASVVAYIVIRKKRGVKNIIE